MRVWAVMMMTFVVAGASASDAIRLTEALVLPPAGTAGRSPLHTDALEARIVAGEWRTPAEGDTVTHPDGTTLTWSKLSANDEGWFGGEEFRRGYALAQVEREAAGVMLLEASGHSAVYVNGALRPGNPYRYGYWRLPVRLRAGKNELLFDVRRGGFSAQLTAPHSPVTLNVDDPTLPDLVVGESVDTQGAVVIVNASEAPLTTARLTVRIPGCDDATVTSPPVPAMSLRKVPFPIRTPARGGTDSVSVELTVGDGAGSSDVATVSLRVRGAHESRKRTFVSDIDGSVQYYAVQPAQPVTDAPLGLVLTLHGAGVEGIGRVLQQDVGAHRRPHEPASVRLRLGGLGPCRRVGGARHREARTGRRPRSHLPHRALHGRTRGVASRCDVPRPVRSRRPKRRLAELRLVHASPGG